jgi:UDP-N-acetylmuramate-alanine ligase
MIYLATFSLEYDHIFSHPSCEVTILWKIALSHSKPFHSFENFNRPIIAFSQNSGSQIVAFIFVRETGTIAVHHPSHRRAVQQRGRRVRIDSGVVCVIESNRLWDKLSTFQIPFLGTAISQCHEVIFHFGHSI